MFNQRNSKAGGQKGPQKKVPVCRHFNTAKGCIKGGECPFRHVVPVCRYFNSAKGCIKGRECPFRHVPLGARPVVSSAVALVKRKPVAFPCGPLAKAFPGVMVQRGKNSVQRGKNSVTVKQVRKTVRIVEVPFTAPPPPAKEKTVAVIFVLDESGSMGVGDKIGAAKGEIVRIVQHVLRPKHYVAVVGFANDVKVYQAPTMKKSLKRGGIKAVVGPCQVRGATALYDGIDTAIGMVRFHAGSHVQIVVLTDGKDNRSKVSYDQICAKVAKPGVANGAKGFFHLTVIGVGRDVDTAKMSALCAPRHCAYIGVGAAGAKDLGAEVRRAFAVVEKCLVRVVTTETRMVTVRTHSKGLCGCGGKCSKCKGKSKGRGYHGGGRR